MTESARIASLDVIRGIALLGILIMNIQAFAMPAAAYTNPAAFGSLDGANGTVWIVSHVLADQKFMAIFSLLFGAGICLFSDRALARSGRVSGLYYRRIATLLAVGVAHGYLLFCGDILTAYALCALWVFLLRNCRPRTLMIVGALLLCVPTALEVYEGMTLAEMPAGRRAAMESGWAPDADHLATVVAGMQGSLLDQIRTRAPITFVLQTFVFAFYFVWRVSGMMLLGMALYRTGFLTGAREERSYTRTAAIGLPLGLALAIWGVHLNFRHDWSFEYSMFFGGIFNYWGSIAVALGYVSLIVLGIRRQLLPAAQARLAAVGRMAFTNYLAQSLLCTVIFSGFDMFGTTPRWQQALVVVGVWGLQLWWSPRWLGRYRMGPLEWLWRGATYGRLEPLRR